MKASIGESQVTPDIMGRITPDVIDPIGKLALFSKLSQAIKSKPHLDSLFQNLAQKVKGDFSSRIKNPETVVQKIAIKRLQGRNYGIPDINDAYGSRITVDKKYLIGAVKTLSDSIQKTGLTILKNQDVKDGTYQAHHIDFQTPGRIKGELQISTPQQELESVANHGLRSIYGQNPQGDVKGLRNVQAKIAENISNNRAKATTSQIQQTAKQNGDRPLDPRIVAKILSNMKQ